MITISSNRRDGPYDDGTVRREVNVVVALWHLLKYELGFGGRIREESSPAKLVVVTQVLNKVDTVTFTGDEVSMRALWEGVQCFAAVQETVNKMPQAEKANQAAARFLSGANQAKPFRIQQMAGLLFSGSKYAKLAFILANGLKDSADIERALKQDEEGVLIPVFELMRETGESFSDVLGAVVPSWAL